MTVLKTNTIISRMQKNRSLLKQFSSDLKLQLGINTIVYSALL